MPGGLVSSLWHKIRREPASTMVAMGSDWLSMITFGIFFAISGLMTAAEVTRVAVLRR